MKPFKEFCIEQVIAMNESEWKLEPGAKRSLVALNLGKAPSTGLCYRR